MKEERRHPWLAQGHNLKTTEKPSHPESNKRAFGRWARRNHDKPGHTQTRRYRFPFLASSSLGKPWQGRKWCLFTQEGIGNNPTPEEEKEKQEKWNTLLDLGGIFTPFWGHLASQGTSSFNPSISGRGHRQPPSRLPAGHHPSASAAATTTAAAVTAILNRPKKLQLIKDK